MELLEGTGEGGKLLSETSLTGDTVVAGDALDAAVETDGDCVTGIGVSVAFGDEDTSETLVVVVALVVVVVVVVFAVVGGNVVVGGGDASVRL